MPTIDTATGEITWSWDEVNAELDRLGLPRYPDSGDFTEDEISDAIAKVDSYYLSKTVAEYFGDKFTSQQVKTWAAFVDTLGKDAIIEATAGGFKVKLPTAPEELRSHVLSDLTSKKSTANRKIAERELTRRYREEHTDAAGYEYKNGITE